MQRVLAGVNGARHVIGHLLARFKTQRVTVERPSFAFLRFRVRLTARKVRLTARKQHPFVSQLYIATKRKLHWHNFSTHG